MSKINSWMIFIILNGFLLLISIKEPSYLSDRNDFLKDFINHNLLNFLGIIITITLASTANIYSELTKKEQLAGSEIFTGTKHRVKQSAISLIACLALAVVVVFSKSFSNDSQIFQSICNSLGLSLIAWGILIILDITKLSFKI